MGPHPPRPPLREVAAVQRLLQVRLPLRPVLRGRARIQRRPRSRRRRGPRLRVPWGRLMSAAAYRLVLVLALIALPVAAVAYALHGLGNIEIAFTEPK